MRFRALRYFLALAEELHYGRAARRLCITQPPLSTSIKVLEQELGVQLFVRTSRDVKLTAAGEAYQVEARKILEGLDRATRIAKAAQEGAAGSLSIGFGTSLIFRGIMDVVNGYARHFPRVDIEMLEFPQHEMLKKLQQAQLDLGFTNTPSVPDGLASLPLTDDEYAICLPVEHPLAQESEIALESVADEQFVMFDHEIGPLNHQTVSAMFHQAGVHPRLIHKTRSWLSMMSLVSAGCGVALLPLSLARVGMNGVAFVCLKGPKTPAVAKLVWREDNENPLILPFVAFAKSMLAETPTIGRN